MSPRRSGAALVIVLFAISLTGALAAGGVYLSRSFTRAVRATVTGADLSLPAEGALVSLIAAWDSAARIAQPLGSTVIASVAGFEAGSTRAWITRLAVDFYWLQAESAAGNRPMLRRRVGLLVTTRSGAPRPAPDRAWSALP